MKPLRIPFAVVVMAGLLSLAAASSYAHQRADLTVAKPAEDAVVDGDAVELVVTASSSAALAEASFTITLDGTPVDTTGTVGAGSVFTTFSLRGGASLMVRLFPVPAGTHELRLAYERDADNIKPEVVRRFTTVVPSSGASIDPSSAGSKGSGVPLPWLAIGGLFLLGVSVATVLLRRERAQSGE